MVDDINKRVMRLLDVFDYSKSNFAKKIDISLPLLTHISNGRNKPGLDLIQKILICFDGIDPDWLLFGKGEMLRKKLQSIDIKDELDDLVSISNRINGVENSIDTVLKYHKILHNELKYISEMSEQLSLIKQEQTELSEEINNIKSKILSKTKT